jgi:hypothetical protein
MEESSTNDLKAVGILEAALAMVVALFLLRATDPTGIAWWWRYPMPLFVIPAVLAAIPLRKPSSKRTFRDGTNVPELLARYEHGKPEGSGFTPYTLEEMLAMLLVDLHASWRNNDGLLAEEQGSFYWGGAAALGVVRLITIGPYPWGLS